MIDFKYSVHPDAVEQSTTELLRKEYLIQNLFTPGKISLTLSDQNRMLVGGVMPVGTIDLGLEQTSSMLPTLDFKTREMGIFNIGGPGAIETDSGIYDLATNDALYVGIENTKLLFHCRADAATPAKFYFNSVPARKQYPTNLIERKKLKGKLRGDPAAATVRNSYLYFSKGAACQLAMGVSAMEPNNVWVGMPPHLHTHRTEVYLYTGFPEENRVYHFMGKPGTTRTLAVKNEQAIISPSWSVHSAVGHHSFSIIWGTCGEVSESGVSQQLLPETLGG